MARNDNFPLQFTYYEKCINLLKLLILFINIVYELELNLN
jgi:hypothetical protein